MDAVPEGIDATAVESYLCALSKVVEVHDLHIWGMSTTEAALTTHLVMAEPFCDNAFLVAVEHELHQRFGIEHATLQLEVEDIEHPCKCRLKGPARSRSEGEDK
jgi:cobalt-zinc-cadmium efflux system protein